MRGRSLRCYLSHADCSRNSSSLSSVLYANHDNRVLGLVHNEISGERTRVSEFLVRSENGRGDGKGGRKNEGKKKETDHVQRTKERTKKKNTVKKKKNELINCKKRKRKATNKNMKNNYTKVVILLLLSSFCDDLLYIKQEHLTVAATSLCARSFSRTVSIDHIAYTLLNWRGG